MVICYKQDMEFDHLAISSSSTPPYRDNIVSCLTVWFKDQHSTLWFTSRYMYEFAYYLHVKGRFKTVYQYTSHGTGVSVNVCIMCLPRRWYLICQFLLYCQVHCVEILTSKFNGCHSLFKCIEILIIKNCLVDKWFHWLVFT